MFYFFEYVISGFLAYFWSFFWIAASLACLGYIDKMEEARELKIYRRRKELLAEKQKSQAEAAGTGFRTENLAMAGVNPQSLNQPQQTVQTPANQNLFVDTNAQTTVNPMKQTLDQAINQNQGSDMLIINDNGTQNNPSQNSETPSQNNVPLNTPVNNQNNLNTQVNSNNNSSVNTVSQAGAGEVKKDDDGFIVFG